MITDKDIKPPTNPVTLKINGWVMDWYFNYFIKKYLPAYTVVVTSTYRDPAHNADIGGVGNSAHLHNLAKDYVLQDANGAFLPASKAKEVFASFILPYWQGFTQFEAATSKQGYHIHANLSRHVTTYAGVLAVGGTGLVAWMGINNILKGNKA